MYGAHLKQKARTLDISGTLYTLDWAPSADNFPEIGYTMSEILNTTDWKWHIFPQGF